MSRFASLSGKILLWLVGGATLIAVLIFIASEVIIRRPPPTTASQLVAHQGPSAVQRGAVVATIYGCAGCHGEGLRGQLFHDEPVLLRGFAPNVTRVVAAHSDQELDRAIRGGVGVDGRRIWLMPSAAFSRLTDDEAADLIAYLRSLPVGGKIQPRSQFGPILRVAMLLGKFQSESNAIADNRTAQMVDLGAKFAAGRKVARACAECHGPTLSGMELIHAPDLMIAASYDAQQFRTLMRTGKASDGREMKLMSSTARSRFNALTDHEIEQLHAYLNARAAAEADRLEKRR